MLDMWDAKNPDFIGYNCRITSYDLRKDSISISQSDSKHADGLWNILQEKRWNDGVLGYNGKPFRRGI